MVATEMTKMRNPLTAADLTNIDGPAWIVCDGPEERTIAAGLVACPHRGTVDVATCLACRYLALVESDRHLAWCDTVPNGPRGRRDTQAPTIARAAPTTPPDLHVELL
jgi:hypothetical protein